MSPYSSAFNSAPFHLPQCLLKPSQTFCVHFFRKGISSGLQEQEKVSPLAAMGVLGPVILGSHCILYKVLKKYPLIFSHRLHHNFLRSFLFPSRSVAANKLASSFPVASTRHSDLVLAPLVLRLFLQLPPICSPRDLRFPMHPLLTQGGFSVAFSFFPLLLVWADLQDERRWKLCTSP